MKCARLAALFVLTVLTATAVAQQRRPIDPPLTAPGAAAPQINKPPKGFTALFNGKDLSGWPGRQPYVQSGTIPAGQGGPARRRMEYVQDQDDWKPRLGHVQRQSHGGRPSPRQLLRHRETGASTRTYRCARTHRVADAQLRTAVPQHLY